MRRCNIALLILFAAPGCAHMSTGIWADSDRGERSMAAIASIELPPEPASVRTSKPDPSKSAKNSGDEWDVPAHARPTSAIGPKIPSAQKEAAAVAESWGPTVKISKTAEFGAEPGAYRWLQGRVSFVKVSGKRVWKMRFAPYDQVDRYGGSFILEGALPPDLKDGDLVRVEGSPAAEETDGRNTRYRCTRAMILKPERSAP